jgi:hypothetical protein
MTSELTGHPGAAGGVRHRRFRPEMAWKGTYARGQTLTD